MTEIELLEQTILALHGHRSRYSGSVAVQEKLQAKTAWQGIVEVFELDGHPQAKFAYAWSHKADDGTLRYVAVLGVSPIDSPDDAVRAYGAVRSLSYG